MSLTAFKQITPTEGLLLTDARIDAQKPYVEVAHYTVTKKGRATDRPRRLAIRTRENGSSYFTWKDESGKSERIDMQDFVVMF